MQLNIIDLRTASIVGAGLAVLDIIINNGNQRPIYNAGGTCANVLSSLSFFGWKSILISRFGSDLAGNILIQDLIDNGVNINYMTQEKNIITPRIIEKLSSNGKSATHNFLLRCPNCESYLPRFRPPRIDSLNHLLDRKQIPEVFFFDRISPAILKLAKYYRDVGSILYFEPNKFKADDKFIEAINLCHVFKYSGKEKKESINNNFDDVLLYNEQVSNCLIIKTFGQYGLSYKLAGVNKWIYMEGIIPDEIFDSCGAGDWCTASFLYYLNNLAQINNLSLITALNHNDIVKKSLNFAQVIASISVKYIGARGLSNAMSKESMFKEYNSRFEKFEALNNFDHNVQIKSKSKYHRISKRKLDEIEYCNVCLKKNEQLNLYNNQKSLHKKTFANKLI